jgi:acetylornithine deacetylase
MPDRTISLLRDLIAIDSINPSLVEGGAGENDAAQRVAEDMRSFGMDVEVSEAAPGRPNVVGVLEGRGAGKSLMLCGHLDTVGVEGMERPFDPVEREGKIYGRGSADMKGGLASMLGAARAVAENGGLKAGRLVVAGVVDEEYKSIGAESLVKRWSADAAVVAEPTGLVVVTAHKGFSWVEVTATGRAAHGSLPHEGRDAILRMGRFLARLEELSRRLQTSVPHPFLGSPSLHCSLIEGGREMSTYPDRCVLKLERRTLPNEQGSTALSEAEEIIEALKKEDAEFEATARLLFERPSYETRKEGELLPLLESSITSTGRTPTQGGMPYWTDAAVLGQAGIPSVIFGPGGAGFHGLEEYVLSDEVLICRDTLKTLAGSFCA